MLLFGNKVKGYVVRSSSQFLSRTEGRLDTTGIIRGRTRGLTRDVSVLVSGYGKVSALVTRLGFLFTGDVRGSDRVVTQLKGRPSGCARRGQSILVAYVGLTSTLGGVYSTPIVAPGKSVAGRVRQAIRLKGGCTRRVGSMEWKNFGVGALGVSRGGYATYKAYLTFITCVTRKRGKGTGTVPKGGLHRRSRGGTRRITRLYPRRTVRLRSIGLGELATTRGRGLIGKMEGGLSTVRVPVPGDSSFSFSRGGCGFADRVRVTCFANSCSCQCGDTSSTESTN